MRPLVLSGGPAVGKSTCARRLAAEHTRAAFVDADDIRELVVAGGETLWSGQEGERQDAVAEEFELLHALMKSPPDVDLVLDVNGMTVDEQTTSIRDAWRHFTDATR